MMEPITSGYYEAPLELDNVADDRVSLDHEEFQAHRMTAGEREHFAEQ
eukprot:SAG22_NODE_9871_length_565_cov_1.107296_1_plen_47_part_10